MTLAHPYNPAPPPVDPRVARRAVITWTSIIPAGALKNLSGKVAGGVGAGQVTMPGSWGVTAAGGACGEAGWPERIIVQERREQTRRAGLETALMVLDRFQMNGAFPASCERMEFRPKTLKIPAHARAAECDKSGSAAISNHRFK